MISSNNDQLSVSTETMCFYWCYRCAYWMWLNDIKCVRSAPGIENKVYVSHRAL